MSVNNQQLRTGARSGSNNFYMLAYPATDMLTHYPSGDDNAMGYRLEAADMASATAAYAAEADRTDPRI